MYSKEHQIYLRSQKRNKIKIFIYKFSIFIFIFLLWEILVRVGIFNEFLTSSPSSIVRTTIDLFINQNLFSHIFTTLFETILGFLIATVFSLLIATLLWWNTTLSKVLDPYLTILNSLPKVSLGPLIIIWAGANVKSILLMAILITVFTSTLNLYTAFIHTDDTKIMLLKTFMASKFQIFKKLIFKSNIPQFINTLKINISMSFIGVIMGELLVSKSGLGYLITYGSQIFNLNLVITSIFILAILSFILYMIIEKIEKRINKFNS